MEAWRARVLEKLHERFLEEWNPLFAWDALRICNIADWPSRPLPDWCMDYLVTLSCRLYDLAALRNAKSRPWRDDDELQAAFEQRLSKWEAKHVTPAEALAQLPWIFDLSRQGWNAFKAYAMEQQDEATSIAFKFKPSAGKRSYVEALARRWNVEEESAERRIRRARRRRMRSPNDSRRPGAT